MSDAATLSGIVEFLQRDMSALTRRTAVVTAALERVANPDPSDWLSGWNQGWHDAITASTGYIKACWITGSRQATLNEPPINNRVHFAMTTTTPSETASSAGATCTG